MLTPLPQNSESLCSQPAAKAKPAKSKRPVSAGLIGSDPSLMEAVATGLAVADTDCTVLIQGETGTGKEVMARFIHEASDRSKGPLVALNCAAIPDGLLEAELFGHTKGAFTGAIAARTGRISAADGGTLLLDEVGELPLPAQAKLLRVLQESQVTPVGSDKAVSVDIRVIAATNRDLQAMVDEGTFRADLFYRLSVIELALPSLRERRSDIPALAKHFIAKTNQKLGLAVSGLSREAEKALLSHGWPGNIRELAHAIERAVIVCREGTIGAEHIRVSRRRRSSPDATPESLADLNLRKAVDCLEERFIKTALERSGGNRTEAAALLGLNRTTLVERLRKIAS